METTVVKMNCEQNEKKNCGVEGVSTIGEKLPILLLWEADH